MSERQIRFGVVGSGHIGKRHAAMIQNHSQAALTGMVDINSGLESAISQEFGVPFFTDVAALLQAHPDTDVVSICTPNNLHAQLAIQALDAGCHVVVEKPMALAKIDAEEVIYKSLQASRLVFCVMQNRYSPPSVWLKEMLSSGRLGQIFHVQVNCFWNRDDRYYKKGGWKGTADQDGGTLFTQFSHFVDIMFWLFGDIKNIQARFYDFNHQTTTAFEDSGFVSFEFAKGGSGTINFSTAVWDKNLESSITIIAENGSIKVGGQYMNEVEYCHVKDYTMPELAPSNPPNDYGPYKGSAANHHFVIENVVDTLLGKTVATTNALEGLKVVEIIEKIYSFKGDWVRK